MKILLLTHAFNGLAQRLFVALREAGHVVSVELDIADAVTEEAVARWNPEVVIAPFLKRRIAESVWSRRLCLVVHPGPPGDRGPSALDWAILQGRREWGVTVLQAVQDFDAGPVWAWQSFAVPAGLSKASLYRRAVCEAAVPAVMAALARVVPGSPRPAPLDEAAGAAPGSAGAAAPAATLEPSPGRTASAEARGWQPLVTREQRAIDWVRHDSAEVLRRIRSADSHPGALGELFGEVCRLYDAHESTTATRERVPTFEWAAPGTVLAHRGPGLLIRTRDGAVWVGHVRREGWRCLEEVGTREPAPALELPAMLAFSQQAAGLPELGVPLHREAGGAHEGEWDELRYVERGHAEVPGARVGWLEFAFRNGALSERQAARLIDALRFAGQRDTQVLVLAGGPDFFCNGIHLHEIEAASQRAGDGAADASMRHIEAIDDVCLTILQMTDRLTVSALGGNAGAGGCFLALAADHVWLREGLVLNPHYRNMGNLHGSEYWTYLLPRRAGRERAEAVMRERLPMGARAAVALGLADEVLVPGEAGDPRADSTAAKLLSALEAFETLAWRRALDLAAAPDIAQRIAAKAARRAADEAAKPLAAYRAEELAQMRRNFYGFDPSYHVARHYFVHRKPHARTPRQIALHR
ncbi:MAG: hydrogenase maturation protein [Rubrivivax sp.]|nr:hydrogenase maturation protein [Rubrivivax sp.]